jgi:hypothetical protein
MRSIVCGGCGQSVPQNSALRVLDRTLCEPCTTTDLQARESVPDGSVIRVYDPTVCALCSYDGGTLELEKIGELPVCQPCERKLRNHPFPTWVKAALAAVLALTIIAMARNYRFFHGYFASRLATRAAARGDFDLAAKRLAAAAASVPEVKQFHTGARLFQGITLMQQDRSAEALAVFQEIGGAMAGDQRHKSLLLQADIGVAFDEKDYPRMVKSSEELASVHPDDTSELFGSFGLCLPICRYGRRSGAAQSRGAPGRDRAARRPHA